MLVTGSMKQGQEEKEHAGTDTQSTPKQDNPTVHV